jgi:hypothetical protein
MRIRNTIQHYNKWLNRNVYLKSLVLKYLTMTGFKKIVFV